MPKSQKKHILVADDDDLIQLLLQRSLSLLNYNVSGVSNGLEALYLLAENVIDVVLMDIKMPIMDGVLATEFLRKCELGEHLSLENHPELATSLYEQRKGLRMPVVAISGAKLTRKDVLEFGMDDYISKPFSLDHVNDVVNSFCEEKKETAEE